MPSGKAGLTTRISTVMKPIKMPKIHRPTLVCAALTGSVAMYTVPKAKPPRVKCQYQGSPNMALESLPMMLSRVDVAIIPTRTPA